MERTRKSGPRGTERDWRDPHVIPADDFVQFCLVHGIPRKDRPFLEEFLGELVIYATAYLRDLRRNMFETDVRSDMKRQAQAVRAVSTALERLDRLPRSSGWQMAPSPGSAELSDVAAVRLPRLVTPTFWAQAILAETPRFLQGTVSTAALEWCHNFTKAHGAEIMRLALSEIASVLESSAERINVSRGARRYVLGPYVLVNLAEAYYRLGHRPVKTTNGPFEKFASDIVNAIGWKRHWIRSQMGHAIDEWRRRQKITPQEN